MPEHTWWAAGCICSVLSQFIDVAGTQCLQQLKGLALASSCSSATSRRLIETLLRMLQCFSRQHVGCIASPIQLLLLLSLLRGVDIKKTLHDFTNYSNADFLQCIQPPVQQPQQQQQSLTSEPLPLPANPTATAAAGSGSSGDGVPMRQVLCPNYQHCLHAWDRQAAYIDWALKVWLGSVRVVAEHQAHHGRSLCPIKDSCIYQLL